MKSGSAIRVRLKRASHKVGFLARRLRLPLRRSGDSADGHCPDNVFDAAAHFSAAGPKFEAEAEVDAPPDNVRATAIAFYLPQFHAIPENDSWWGTGFTEWRNLARAMPRFRGHYQPRIPRDLGFYDLGQDCVLERQCELASNAGIAAFCFYYYWFNGKRLLDAPLNRFTELESLTMPFCILWANENWTRRWDGRDRDVLISQDYDAGDEAGFVRDTAQYLSHPRYLQIDGRPLFLLYRASLLPDARSAIARWRKAWLEQYGLEPWVFMVQSGEDRDPREFGCDGALEFPPHKVTQDIGRCNHELTFFDASYSGQVRRYADMVAKSLADCQPDFPLLKTVSPHWDNEPRRPGRGVTLHGSTPLRYARWLSALCRHGQRNRFANESLVFHQCME